MVYWYRRGQVFIRPRQVESHANWMWVLGRKGLAEIGTGGDGLRPIDFGRGFIENRGEIGLVVHR